MQVGAILAVTFVVLLLIATIVDDFSTRKVLKNMSLALDNLTVQVAAIETQATAAVAAIAQLQAAGENAPALDALTTRLKAASDGLAAALAPKV